MNLLGLLMSVQIPVVHGNKQRVSRWPTLIRLLDWPLSFPILNSYNVDCNVTARSWTARFLPEASISFKVVASSWLFQQQLFAIGRKLPVLVRDRTPEPLVLRRVAWRRCWTAQFLSHNLPPQCEFSRVHLGAACNQRFCYVRLIISNSLHAWKGWCGERKFSLFNHKPKLKHRGA